MNAVLLVTASLLLLVTSGYAGPCGCSSQKELPARIDNEDDITYYKRIFPIDISCGCKENLKKFYDSVFYKYEGETEETYVIRIDILFDQIYPNIDCRTNSNYADYLDKYYICKYGKNKRENDEVFFERVLKKSSESGSDYRCKIELMKRFVRSVDWSKVSIEENTSKGYSIVKKSSNQKKDKNKIKAQKCEHEENVETVKAQKSEHDENVNKIKAQKSEHDENVNKIKAQKSEHDENVKKIKAQKSEHDENVKKIKAQKSEHDENVNKIKAQKSEHEENVKKWIKAHYKRGSGESIDNYYSRICSRDSISDEEYVNRLTIARSLFSDLDLWYSEKYLSETKYYYKLVFSKKSTETDLEYYNRLLSKEDYESEENFLNRITLLQKIFASLSLWYDDRFYETYTYKLYQHSYEKGENEQDEEYLKRVLTKLDGESEEYFWKRANLIKKTFPNYPCWYNKENLKNLDFCTSLHAGETVDDLKNIIYSETISEECRENKIECLKTFFESSNSSCS